MYDSQKRKNDVTFGQHSQFSTVSIYSKTNPGLKSPWFILGQVWDKDEAIFFS